VIKLTGSPLSTIRNTLLRPQSESTIAPSVVGKLLATIHLERLRSPWQPFKPYSAATAGKRAAGSNVTIPGTSASFEVTSELESLADKLAKRADIGSTDSLVLCRSYELHSLDDDRTSADTGRLARVLAWWSEETVAVAEIVVTLLLLGTGSEGQSWTEMASSLRETVMAEPEQYLEQLFRAFSNLAQKPLEGDRRSEYPLFW
jgi:nuclear pore complex protein Nup188